MRERGFAEETRLHGHGQGYDSVERPLVRHDEEMTIEADMNIGIHPSVLTRDLFATVCDNFLTRPDGSVERLHRTPQKIFELRSGLVPATLGPILIVGKSTAPSVAIGSRLRGNDPLSLRGGRMICLVVGFVGR
ncbi:MAG: hypothetical protein ACJ8DQ_07085 [Xanthobacteraceae bacterium]